MTSIPPLAHLRRRIEQILQPISRAVAALALVASCVTEFSLAAADWPQWRGPARDGIAGDPLPDRLPAQPAALWHQALGHGYAAPVIAGDRLLVFEDANGQETARCLNENVLTSVHDANIGSIFGIGFPAWTGGAMQFIYGMGIDAFAARCANLSGHYGPGFVLTDAVLETIRKFEPVY